MSAVQALWELIADHPLPALAALAAAILYVRMMGGGPTTL
jgi:hypothetical protein